jgi:HEAT repeat protein
MSQQNQTLPPDRQEIDDIIERFLGDDLTLEEAEQAIRRLHDAGKGVVSKLLALLDEANPDQHTVAAVLLAATRDARLVPDLVERVRDPSVEDLLKVKLITAIGQLDPSRSLNELFDHLQDAPGALRRARQTHLELIQSPQDLAEWLESLQVEMDATSRLYVIENSIELDDPAAVPMLICLCYDPDDDVALSAMDAVERFKDARALRALEELSAWHPHKAVRLEAQKTVDRLRIRASLAEQHLQAPVAPVHSCYLTPIDSAGGQVAIVIRQQAGGDFTLVSVMLGEDGIESCFGADLDPDELEEMLGDYEGQEVFPVHVSHAACMSVLDLAVEATWSSGRLLPMSFLAWRAVIEDGRPSGQEAALPLTVPPGRRADSLLHCYELLFQDEFRFWLFPPDEMDDLRARYVDKVKEAGHALDRDSVAEFLRQGVRELVDADWRRAIRGRLLRMVSLLHALYVDEEVWQWAAVAADTLADDSTLPVEDHPFLIGMLACSLEEAIGGSIGWFDA